ncbi:MAG: ABC transporter permease [Candidatus Omnitrophica bacterium]|nr:ABC transporter permease [Candidatus Omnitrophota bacterium]
MKNNKQKVPYEIIIKANRNWFYIDWRGLLHYRDLLFLLVKRDFISRYKQTILGPLWFFIQPIVTTLVFTVVFNRVAKLSTDKLPPFLFYLCGITIWDYFSRCVAATSISLISHAQLFEKVYFPRLIVPLSNILSNLFSFAIQIATFVVFYIYFKYFTGAGILIDPSPHTLAILPILLLQTAAFALGVGLWVSALTAKYRDLSLLMTFIIQLWMYVTPVIYPVSTIPSHWRFIMAINPMASVVDLFRYAFFGTVALSLKYLGISILITVLTLVSGLLVFNKIERTFVDTV